MVVIVLITAFLCQVRAQNCDIIVDGQVIDEASQAPLSYVNIFVQELHRGTTTDIDGRFSIDSLCIGEYHFIFSHIGCDGKKFHFDIEADTTLNVILSHSSTVLGTVVVDGKRDSYNNQPNVAVNRKTIEDNTNQNLSGILENETGVHLIKNGNGISKPVVQGMYGNRLTILNNGIIQSGQQWGNDHSPEIDPFSADKITILKGVSAIEYGGGNLGSIVLTEPKPIEDEPHLHGQVNYIFESNGRGNTLNTRLEKYGSAFAWRLNGTLKKYGDRKTADYYLNNTGAEEANLSLQIEKSWNDNLFVDFYASSFNTRLGVLRGSHIGNLTDLEQALTKEVPFFTESKFSYDIDAPKQEVSHHLATGKAKYFFSENKFLEVVLAGQLNDRKEFDVRRQDRTTRPALSLTQYTFNTELKYTNYLDNDWKIKLGNQYIFTDNTNNPETGILPLIPDYFSWRNSVFGSLSKSTEQFFFNWGLRYDYEQQTALAISNSLPREIVRYKNNFQNLSGLFVIRSKIHETQSLSYSAGYAMRNPAINELYSIGLHQGVSGIEEGNIGLQTEKAFKNTLEYEWFPSSEFTLNAIAYYQRFNDYIYLNPQAETRLTIRGAFPVFSYEQTDARIYGMDISTQFTLSHVLYGLFKFSYIKGKDITNDLPLIFIPPSKIFGSLTYRAHKPIHISKRLQMEDSEIEISNRLVFRQHDILEDQDFVLPPPAYYILGVKLSTQMILSRYKLRCFVRADNVLNAKYRDYLNRQRYFADDLGRSITVGINVKF